MSCILTCFNTWINLPRLMAFVACSFVCFSVCAQFQDDELLPDCQHGIFNFYAGFGRACLHSPQEMSFFVFLSVLCLDTGSRSGHSLVACDKCRREMPRANLDLHRIRCTGIAATASSAAASGSTSSSKKKKQKAKSKGSSASAASNFTLESDDFDTIVEEARKQDSVCAMPACKKALGLLGRPCEFCRRGFCLTHLQAEVHGCGDAARQAARRQAGTTSKSTSAKKTAQLQKKLHAQIDKKEQQRSAKKKK